MVMVREALEGGTAGDEGSGAEVVGGGARLGWVFPFTTALLDLPGWIYFIDEG